MTRPRPLHIERRALAPRAASSAPRAHAAGTAAVEAELFPLAAELRACLAGRMRWPAEVLASEAGGR